MTMIYRLNGLCCANCASKIERMVQKLKTVDDATLNFMTSKLIVDIENDVEQTEEEILRIVKKIEPDVVVVRG